MKPDEGVTISRKDLEVLLAAAERQREELSAKIDDMRAEYQLLGATIIRLQAIKNKSI